MAEVKTSHSLPISLSVTLLIVPAFFYFFMQASPIFSITPEGKQFTEMFPILVLVLGAVSVAFSYIHVAKERAKAHQYITQEAERKNRIAKILTQVIANDYSGLDTIQDQNDPVIQALRTMRERLNLIRTEEDERQRKTNGIAYFSDLLRKHFTIESLATDLVRNLAKYLHSEQGAIFVIHDENQSVPSMAGYFVSDQVEPIIKDYLEGEGAHGQVLKDGKTLIISDIPSNYLHIDSGLGSAPPKYLLLIPLLFEGQSVGVIELASFHPYTPADIAFAEEVASKSAVTIFNLKTSEKTERMLAEAQKLATEIKVINESLEDRVQERTAELQKAMDELQNAQFRVVQSEKLASLGQLIAGVAHEINTPLAAIKAAAENMSDFLPLAIRELPVLLMNLNDDQRKIFLQLVEESMMNREELTTRDERNLSKQFQETLQEAGVDNARDIAKRLVTNGIRGELTSYIPLLHLPNSKEIIQTSYHLAQMKSNLNVIGQAAAKTRKTVYALKRYSHFQQDEKLEVVDLVDSLEVILTLYHNQLKHGVTVERKFDKEIPPILGYGDELGQVWTNIIHNAAQAMKYNGNLTVEISRKGDQYAIVSITDNGPGIPPEIKERIFEPFFTTKPQGEGTGLGLDICRKIVEKHRGTIHVDSEPGRTCFTVTLPFQPEGNAGLLTPSASPEPSAFRDSSLN